jgi:hypothetical protein
MAVCCAGAAGDVLGYTAFLHLLHVAPIVGRIHIQAELLDRPDDRDLVTIRVHKEQSGWDGDALPADGNG